MIVDDYEIIFDGKRRYYLERLEERDYNLENTTPHCLFIHDSQIIENSWVEMIRNLSFYLLENNPIYKQSIYDFSVDWSKQKIFTKEKHTNFKKIYENLYVNCNHTALHSCWIIQDLLEYFNINLCNVKFYIHRPSSSEPVIVKEKIYKKNIEEFSLFLFTNYNKDKDQCEKIIDNITKYMNPILKKFSKSYDNVFLFDDYAILYNYIAKIMEYVNINVSNVKARNSFHRYGKYLLEFYKL